MKHFILFTLVLLLFRFSPAVAGEWEIVSEMPVPVSGAVAFTSDSLIYIFGGHNSRDFITPALMQIYNPILNSWRVDTIGTIQNSRYGANGGIWQGTAYFFGGQTDSVTTDLDVLGLDDSNQLSFSNRNDNFNRYFASSEIYNGKIYCFGGYSVNSGVIDRLHLPYIFIYDLATNTVETEINSDFTTELPYYQMTTRIDNRIYILGGTFNGVLNTISYFDTESKMLHNFGRKMSKARYGGTAHAFGDSIIALIGGWDGRDQVLSDMEIINIKNQVTVSPTEIMHLNQARAEHVSVKFADAIYVFGGRNTSNDGGTDISEVEKYDFGLITNMDNRRHKPLVFKLHDNYPNPFNPKTIINYQISMTNEIDLSIYNIIGQKVATLVKEIQRAGDYNVTFDASSLPSGIYFYTLNSAGYKQTKRMVLIK